MAPGGPSTAKNRRDDTAEIPAAGEHGGSISSAGKYGRGAVNREVWPVARRINFLSGGMLCVSALAHGALLLMFNTQAVPPPPPARYLHVSVLGERAAGPRTLPATQAQPPPRQEAAPRQDAKLPLIERRTAIHREPVLKRMVKSPPVDRQPRPPARPAKKGNREVVSQSPQPAAAGAAAQGKEDVRNGQPGGGPRAGSSGGADVNAYFAEVVKKIEQYKEYPRRARTGRIEGRATVRFHLLADGHIRPPEVVRSSGHAILDQSALAAVRRAAPYTRPPAELSAGGPIPLEVVLVFQLH